ncbi:MAG: DUF559 domain-containing protein [Clostridia bacterium]|nr:DUF559 domain-containing protein [Clostridia bacterium]
MNDIYNPRLKPFSQKLRCDMTKEERHLWYDFLRTLSVTVNRQKVIGDYIVDFYIASAKTIIELDGSQHFEEKGVISDNKRDEYFASLGLQVLRYPNNEINHNFSGVCEDILRCINTSSTASGSPSPQGEC